MKMIIKNGRIINEGKIIEGDLLIKDERIEQLGGEISHKEAHEIIAEGKYVMPGIIDDQVHFREPGYTHKANIATESLAAACGGVTSFMEMPNTKPTATTQERLAEKYEVAKKTAFTNYSFFMGASNDNIEEVLKTNARDVCGVKIFMGSSTGNMLVDNRQVLDQLFSKVDLLIATHCEDETTIRANVEKWKTLENVDASQHPLIRNVEGCYLSSSMAIDLAKKHDTRLHILHISTQDEISLFDNETSLADKRITAEVCVHHLFFNADDYAEKGNLIKCNPAIKAKHHQAALFDALLDNHFDIIATDHAPHTWEEKSKDYWNAPSGLPLVQHSLLVMFDFMNRGKISVEKVVEKMCHAPAICFKVQERGFLRENYFADIVIVDPNKKTTVSKENIRYKCGWSPLEGKTFHNKVDTTIINGKVVFQNDEIKMQGAGQRLLFR